MSEIPRHAVGNVGIHTTILVEVLQLRRPTPVGIRQSGEVGSLAKLAFPFVHQKRIAHVLPGVCIFKEPLPGGHCPHSGLLSEMVRSGHI